MINSVEKHYNQNSQFIDYKMTLSNGEVWFIPLDEANSDYQEIQQWVVDGGTITDPGV